MSFVSLVWLREFSGGIRVDRIQSSFTLCSSSFVLCRSSFEACSSSFVVCISSFAGLELLDRGLQVFARGVELGLERRDLRMGRLAGIDFGRIFGCGRRRSAFDRFEGHEHARRTSAPGCDPRQRHPINRRFTLRGQAHVLEHERSVGDGALQPADEHGLELTVDGIEHRRTLPPIRWRRSDWPRRTNATDRHARHEQARGMNFSSSAS